MSSITFNSYKIQSALQLVCRVSNRRNAEGDDSTKSEGTYSTQTGPMSTFCQRLVWGLCQGAEETPVARWHWIRPNTPLSQSTVSLLWLFINYFKSLLHLSCLFTVLYLIAAFEPYRCGVLISVASLSDAERVCRARLSSNVKLKYSMIFISHFQQNFTWCMHWNKCVAPFFPHTSQFRPWRGRMTRCQALGHDRVLVRCHSNRYARRHWSFDSWTDTECELPRKH